MFLFVFFEVAHIKIFLVASFDFAHVFLPSLLIFEVDLHMLFQVSRRCEGFAAFLADERLLLGVDTLVPVEVGLLIETLITVLEVALVGFNPLVGQFMSLEC